MSTAPQTVISPEAYLAAERASETRHEYFDGGVFTMAGASEKHVQIVFNLSGILYVQLRKRPCKAYTNDMRVKINAMGAYVYPDVIALCSEPQFDDAQQDTLLNPAVIIEVLSPSTTSYDKGEKFLFYQTLPSLQEYLLIAQDRILIIHCMRQESGFWDFKLTMQREQSIDLGSIGCTLLVADIYEKSDL